MRVLIVNRYMSVYGGAEQVVCELCRHLSANNIANEVLALNISDEVIRRNPDMKVTTGPVNFPYALRSASFRQSLGIVNEIDQLRRLVRQRYREFDVINLHNFPASWAAVGCDKPVVWMCNEIPDFYNNPSPSAAVRMLRAAGIGMDKRIVNKSVAIICVADKLNAKAVRARYGRESMIIPYGVDFPDNFSFFEGERPSLYEHYGLAPDDFLLLQVGVISPTKNQKASIDCLRAIKDAIPQAKLVLAGSDQNAYAQSLKKYVEQYGLQKQVRFTGLLTKEDVHRLYGLCQLCLFPVKLQGGYLSVFEAIGFGLPVIVSPQMGAAELVAEQDLGLVSDSFAETAIEVHRNYAHYREKAKTAAQWVKGNLTWASFAEKMRDVFSQAMRGERL